MAEEVKANEYPKWIDHPSETKGETKDGKRIPHRVLVQNAKEEAELLGTKAEVKKSKDKPEGWAG